MIVMKFGGTSVESAAAIERVAGIVNERRDRHPVVVVSAMGKTTNKLLAIAAAAIEGTTSISASFTTCATTTRAKPGRWRRSRNAPPSTAFSTNISRSSPNW
jgi:aspartokinase